MDSDLIKTFAAAVAGGLTSLAMLPMLFKGALLFRRELDALAASHAKIMEALKHEVDERIRLKNERYTEIVTIKDKEIANLQESNVENQRLLREQYALNAELTREVFSAVSFLQSMAGLAAKNQRGAGT